jgi:hypothetical protein
MLADGVQLRAAGDNADLFASLGELGGEQAADGPGADHAYLHRTLSVLAPLGGVAQEV